MNNELDKERVDRSTNLADSLNGINDFTHQSQYYSMIEYMKGSLQQVSTERATYYNELEKYRDNYIVNGIYDIIGNDVFIDTGNIDYLSIEYTKDEDVQEELRDMFRKLNISTLLISILPDLLHYGSYPLRPVIHPEMGVVGIKDDLEPSSVIAICDTNNYPLFYFVDESLKTRGDSRYIDYRTRSKFKYYSIKDIAFFSLDLDFIKLRLPKKIMDQFKVKSDKNPIANKIAEANSDLLPDALKIKTSKSFIYGSLDKLKECLLQDKIAVYRDLAALLSPNLIGIPVPDIYDPAQLIDVVQKYDTLLNSDIAKLNNNMDFQFSLADIARLKVVPIAGDRSTPTPIDTGAKNTVIDPELLNNTLAKFLNSLGIPVELFSGSSDSKTNLKTNVRYAKKIKRIQKNISKSLVYLCLMHLSIKYPGREIFADDINIQLKNNINIDELENLEAQDLVISSVSSMFGLFETIKETVRASKSYQIDPDEFIKAVKDGLSSIGSPYQNTIADKTAETDIYGTVSKDKLDDSTFKSSEDK